MAAHKAPTVRKQREPDAGARLTQDLSLGNGAAHLERVFPFPLS